MPAVLSPGSPSRPPVAPGSSPVPLSPVLVVARVPEVVRAGVEVMVRGHEARIVLVVDGEDARAHVELFDPSATGLRPAATIPRVALMWDTSAAAVERAHRLGADRVLSLGLDVDDLVSTCEQAGRGWSASPGGEPLLSPREVDVIRGICRGLSNADIAEELYVSVNSVKTYIRTAYRKMGVASRSQAVLWGLERRL